MKASAFAASIDELYERLKSLTVTKGEEYKRRDDNQFSNFERGAAALGLTREQVLMVYLSKHLDSITTYVRDRARGEETHYAEPITGRIDDAILYMLLLRGMAVQNEVKTILDEMPRTDEVQNYGGDPLLKIGTRSMEVATARRTVRADSARRVSASELVAVAEEVGAPLYAEECKFTFPADPILATTVGFDGVAGPVHKAFETAAAALPAKSDRPPVIISSHQPDALAMAALMGLPAATCALSTTDQLHGVAPGAHVIFIHHGSRVDEAMYAEVIARCDKQGLTHERVDK